MKSKKKPRRVPGMEKVPSFLDKGRARVQQYRSMLAAGAAPVETVMPPAPQGGGDA